MSNLILEIMGDFHPLLVHFPVGIMGLIAISILLTKTGKLELPLPYFRLINYFCLFALVLTVGLGLACENSRSYSGNDSSLMEWHEKLGFGTLSTFCLASIFLFLSVKNKSLYKWYEIFFIFSLVFVAIGGHLGSTVAHGEIKLIKIFSKEEEKIMPEPSLKLPKIDSVVPVIKSAKIDFDSQIRPILEKNCFKCHGPKKQKGDLRLDKNDFKQAIEPFKPELSDLYNLISLPEDDDDLMPPKGGPLPKELIDTIYKWIKEGAEMPPPIK